MANSVQITKVCIMYPLSTATFALVLLISCNETTTMETLYADIDAVDITSYLQENKYEYKLDSNKKTIFVPKDSVYKIRMDLAVKGLPKYKDIDRNICISERNYKTPIVPIIEVETELVRSIETLGEVDQAEVQIYIPKKTLFMEEKPSAKVIVNLGIDKNLQERHIKGIQHLVSIAIEDIEANQVEVLDIANKFSTHNPTEVTQ